MANSNLETLALLHFDGNIKDEMGNKWIASSDNYQMVDDPEAFNGKCILLDGMRLYCENDEFAFGNEDFTVEYRVKPVSGTLGLVSATATPTDVGFLALASADYWCIGLGNGSGLKNWILSTDSSWAVPGQWFHCAFVRKEGTSYWFINGVLKASGYSTHCLDRKMIAINSYYGDGKYFSGGKNYYDEICISKGAKWTEDFEPPTEPLNPDQPSRFVITEKYQAEDGTTLQVEIKVEIEEGAAYIQTAPQIAGYDYLGYKINNDLLQQGSTAQIDDIAKDQTVTFIYKFIEPEPQSFIVTEKYQDEEDKEIQPETKTIVSEGESYSKEAQAIMDYEYVGYTLGGAALQTSATVLIPAIGNDHVVVFVYKYADSVDPGPQPKEKFTIIEKYQDEEGSGIKADTAQSIEEGEDYLQVAVNIKDYEYLGCKIDDGELQKGSFVTINEIEQEHIVVFIYKKKKTSGNNNGSSGGGNGNNNGGDNGEDDNGLDSFGCCGPVNIFNFYQCCCDCGDGESSGAGQTIPNTNGRSWSLPVPARPLSDEVALTGYPLAMSIWNVSRGCSFDGKYIWSAPLNGRIERIEPETAEIEVFEAVVEGQNIAAQEMIFAADYLWTVASGNKFLVKMDTETAAMEKIDLATAYNFIAATYDGKNIWFVDNGKLLVKFNPENYQTEEYELPLSSGSKSLLYANGSIWVIHRFGYQIIKVALSDLEMEVLEIDKTQEDLAASSDVCLSATTDGHYIWLAPSCFATVIRIDSQTNEFTYIPIEGENLGSAEESYPGSRVYSRFGSCGYDGKYVWFFPYAVNRIVRMDTQSNEFVGYDTSEGEDLGSIPNSIAKFWGSCFDGKNFWLMPGQADKLVKLEPTGDEVIVDNGKDNNSQSKKSCSKKKGCVAKNIFNLYQTCQPQEFFCQPKLGCNSKCK